MTLAGSSVGNEVPCFLPPLWLRTWPLCPSKAGEACGSSSGVIPSSDHSSGGISTLFTSTQASSSGGCFLSFGHVSQSSPFLLQHPEGLQGSPNSLPLSSSPGPPSRSLYLCHICQAPLAIFSHTVTSSGHQEGPPLGGLYLPIIE